MSVIHKYTEQWRKMAEADTAPPAVKHPRNIRTKFLQCLTNMLTITKGKKSLRALQITELTEHERTANRCDQASKVLKALARG